MARIEKVIFMNMCMVYDKEGNVVALDKVENLSIIWGKKIPPSGMIPEGGIYSIVGRNLLF